jgi:hypothetical protein
VIANALCSPLGLTVEIEAVVITVAVVVIELGAPVPPAGMAVTAVPLDLKRQPAEPCLVPIAGERLALSSVH